MAELFGTERETYKNWEYGVAAPAHALEKLSGLLARNEVGEPTVPASELEVPVPYIGAIAASSPAEWTDPFEAERWEFIPGHMVVLKGLFSCSVGSDCMMPMLEPEDLCLFRADDGMKLNRVVLFRSHENTVTIKQLKHDGRDFYLHPLNSAYEDIRERGRVIGYLVGYVRRLGKRVLTEYDPDGLIP